MLIYGMVRSYRANYECVEYLQTTKQCIPKIWDHCFVVCNSKEQERKLLIL
ncbi:hypothetical protein SRABI134_04894 [Peribacillus sp. Bi134]|nr:hypothetical protein SRABI134_04894 [Peribacillus sp. Bi134]